MYPAERPVRVAIPQSGIVQSERERISKLFSSCQVKALSIIQLVCAGLSAVFQFILIGKAQDELSDVYEKLGLANMVDPGGRGSYGPFEKDDIRSFMSEIATVVQPKVNGLWFAIFFGISGGIGLLVSKKPSNCNVFAFMILNMISSCSCLPLIVSTGIGLNWAIRPRCDMKIAIYTLQLVIALLQAATAITAFGYSVRVVCCNNGQNRGTMGFSPQIVQYHNQRGVNFSPQTAQPQNPGVIGFAPQTIQHQNPGTVVSSPQTAQRQNPGTGVFSPQNQTLQNTQILPNTSSVSPSSRLMTGTNNPGASTTSASGIPEKPPIYSPSKSNHYLLSQL